MIPIYQNQKSNFYQNNPKKLSSRKSIICVSTYLQGNCQYILADNICSHEKVKNQ